MALLFPELVKRLARHVKLDEEKIREVRIDTDYSSRVVLLTVVYILPDTFLEDKGEK